MGLEGELRKTEKIWITQSATMAYWQLQNTMSANCKLHILLHSVVLGKDKSLPGDIWQRLRTFSLSCLVGMLLASYTGKARNAGKQPKRHRAAPHNKNSLILNVKFQGWETLFSSSSEGSDYVLAFETCHNKFRKTEIRQHIFPNHSEIKL